jgi:hypothetical protein
MSEMTTAESGAATTEAGNTQTESQATQQATQTPAGQTEQQTQGEQKPADQAEQKQVEEYKFEMPEGMEVDKAAADEFSQIAKDLKLDQEAAGKLAQVGVKMMQRQVEAHANLVQGWVDQVKADKEIGGDKFDESLAVARKAMDAFGTPGLKEILDSTGLGNHPEVIRAFVKAGKAISEDRVISGKPPGTNEDPAKKLFPSMN